ncbi:class I SAM-dependent methyltransferase [Longimicrobium sp.]|uniref:class I SAM-dependent methyltransferase n=1 Tax=Longimicrobium sp. TaxID=2029185 RepID=UPI002F931E4E
MDQPQDSPVSYENQAALFDERAGLPPHAAEAVASALEEIVGMPEGQRWLEVGAGTGNLILPLLRRPIRYVGFDRSPGMLHFFRLRAAKAGLHPDLRVADGNDPWPAADGSVDVVFSARALHHLDLSRVVPEVRRVLSPGGWLVVGRVRRPPDSPRAVLRRRMRQLLNDELGYTGRSGERHMEAVFGALQARGAIRQPPRIAATWTKDHAPADSLASWREKSGLAGLGLLPDMKAHILGELEAWARTEFGDLHRPLPQDESFEIQAIRL